MLIKIEEQTHTGFIKVDAIREALIHIDEERKRQEISQLINESGFSREDIISFLSEEKKDSPKIKKVQLSSDEKRVLEENLYNDNIRRLKEKYKKS